MSKVIEREPYKFTFQKKEGEEWINCGRITYGRTHKSLRRKKSNHNPEWVND